MQKSTSLPPKSVLLKETKDRVYVVCVCNPGRVDVVCGIDVFKHVKNKGCFADHQIWSRDRYEGACT